MKTGFYGCFLLLFTLLLTSCWDRKEMNGISIVMMSGLDAASNGQIIATAQIPVPSGGNSGGGSVMGEKKDYLVLSAQGEDIHDAMQFLQEKLTRRLFYSHRRVIVIGESLAKRGIKDVLDHFSRDPNSRLRTYIVVAKGKQAGELFNVNVPFEHVPAEGIKDLETSQIGQNETLRDFLIAASTVGIVPVTATIETTPATSLLQKDRSQDSKNNNHSGRDMFRLSGSAVFKDYKLVGYLNDMETIGLLWITGKLNRGTVTAHIPKAGTVSLEIFNIERKIKTDLIGDEIVIHVRLSAKGPIRENNTNLDLSRPDNVRKAEDALKHAIEQRLHETVAKAQGKLQSDIFGFGEVIHRKHPKQWRSLQGQWEEKFPQAKVIIETKVNVARSGMAGAPLHLNEKDVDKE